LRAERRSHRFELQRLRAEHARECAAHVRTAQRSAYAAANTSRTIVSGTRAAVASFATPDSGIALPSVSA
jgi:hypothetical protein